MARIRSVHPGQWTDEDFLSCSFPARLLAIALRNEADDGGVFSWKPITLKMRLMPADNVDITALLSELEGADVIRRYEVDGRNYGAIRNFQVFQRPKAPKMTHPQAAWVPEYVGNEDALAAAQERNVSETVGKRFGNGSQIGSQMDTDTDTEVEEEGGAGETTPSDPVPNPSSDGVIIPIRESKRVRRMEDLKLDDELRKLAATEGKSPERELAKFTDWIRKTGKRQNDYKAGFRNWLRSDYGKPPVPEPPRQRDWSIPG